MYYVCDEWKGGRITAKDDVGQAHLSLKAQMDSLDSQIRTAKKKLEELEDKRQKVQEAYVAVSRLLGEDVSIGSIEANPSDQLSGPSPAKADAPRGAGQPEPKTPSQYLMEQILLVIRDHPNGIHVRGVYEALRQRGVLVPGNLPLNNVNNYMCRSDKLDRVGKGTYRLRPGVSL